MLCVAQVHAAPRAWLTQQRCCFAVRSKAAREAVCALAAAAGELLSPRHCGAGHASSPGGGADAQEAEDGADAATASGGAAAQCRALRAAPFSALLLPRAGLPAAPYFDARASYIAVLDEGTSKTPPRRWRSVADALRRSSSPSDDADDAPALRALGGDAARAAPRGGLTAAHLAAAKAR